MKKVLIFIFVIALGILVCGCGTKQVAETEKQPITVNLPKDDTVNGYKESSGTMPESINASDVTPDDNNISYSYCGNKNSKKFHKISCSALKSTKDGNKVYYKTRDEFITKGFEPCKMCNP